jgi:hypothetical protein
MDQGFGELVWGVRMGRGELLWVMDIGFGLVGLGGNDRFRLVTLVLGRLTCGGHDLSTPNSFPNHLETPAVIYSCSHRS